MRSLAGALILVLAFALNVCGQGPQETFHEELLLKPLRDNLLLAHFRFTHQSERLSHYTLFPRAISRLSESVRFDALELSFTHGRWRYNKWGQPVATAPPVGAELRVLLPAGTTDTAAALAWGNLTHALGGTFCASLNVLSRPGRQASRAFEMQPSGRVVPAEGRVLQASLPKEPVCSENLTPWLKLLPCRGAAGLARLLNRPKVYSAAYHSMAVSVTVKPHSLELVQSLTLVLRLAPHRPAVGGISRPSGLPSWSLGSVFNADLSSSCPLAESSRVHLLLPAGAQAALQPQPSVVLWALTGQQQQQAVHSYDLHQLAAAGGSLDISLQQQQQGELQLLLPEPEQPLLQVHSYTSGSGNLHGGIVLELAWQGQQGPGGAANISSSSAGTGTAAGAAAAGAAAAGAGAGAAVAGAGAGQALPVCIFQALPWHVRVWLHTLQLQLDGRPADLWALTLSRRLLPSQDRRRQLQLELCLALPAGTQRALLTAEFSKAFLTVFECPPDTNRGQDVPAAEARYPDVAAAGWRALECAPGADARACEAARASPLLRQLQQPRAQQQHSEGLLVPLAAPDFSMPYNVCCLTSTVLAVYIGATLNALMSRHKGSSGAGGRAETRRKVAKFVVVVGVFGGLALYLDEALRQQVVSELQQLGIRLH